MDFFVVLTFIISVIIGIASIPRIVLISKKKRLFDTINSRKVHVSPTPRLGGISFFCALFISFCFVIGLRSILGHGVSAEYYRAFNTEFELFTAGAMLLFFIGLCDDLIEVGYKLKFLMQAIAAALISASPLYIDSFQGLFSIYTLNPVFAFLFTVIAIVLIINAYNLIDGIDGLCSGLATLSILTLSIWLWIDGYYAYAMLGMSLVGCVIVFFCYNVFGNRLKVFMGDAGSLVIGFTICFLGLKFIDVNTVDMIGEDNSMMLVLSTMFVPVFDTTRVFIERIMKGKSPFNPDKSHLHHHMLLLGFSHIQSTVIIISLAALLIIINFINIQSDINLLFTINILYGIILLVILPKILVRRGVKITLFSKKNSKKIVK